MAVVTGFDFITVPWVPRTWIPGHQFHVTKGVGRIVATLAWKPSNRVHPATAAPLVAGLTDTRILGIMELPVAAG